MQISVILKITFLRWELSSLQGDTVSILLALLSGQFGAVEGFNHWASFIFFFFLLCTFWKKEHGWVIQARQLNGFRLPLPWFLTWTFQSLVSLICLWYLVTEYDILYVTWSGEDWYSTISNQPLFQPATKKLPWEMQWKRIKQNGNRMTYYAIKKDLSKELSFRTWLLIMVLHSFLYLCIILTVLGIYGGVVSYGLPPEF